jgi:hypothetical protein
MIDTGCIYSIVRFSPFVETGEFANVGIVMMAPEQRYFDFKLVGKRHARVTRFFEPLDVQVFKATLETVRAEMERVAALLLAHGFDKKQNINGISFAKQLFLEMIRPRETVVKFSPPRMALMTAPQERLDALFKHYVVRDFVTPEYQEGILERNMRDLFSKAHLADRFEKYDVGNDEYHASFPFVEHRGETPVKAIKALNLSQTQPNKIIDHGGQWSFRVNELKKRNFLPPNVLFAFKPPPPEDTPRVKACEEIVARLKETGVTVLSCSDEAAILEFAAG